MYIYPIGSTPLESLTKYILIPNRCMKKVQYLSKKKFSKLIKKYKSKHNEIASHFNNNDLSER